MAVFWRLFFNQAISLVILILVFMNRQTIVNKYNLVRLYLSLMLVDHAMTLGLYGG